MTSKLNSYYKRIAYSSLSRHLRLESLEPRQCMDAAGELSQMIAPSSDSASQSSLQSSASKLMEFRIQLTDMQGNSIDSVRVDEDFWINVYVRDLRDLPPNSLHLFSAYAELYLDSNLFVATGKGSLGKDFWEYKSQSSFQDALNSLQESIPDQIGGLVTARYPEGPGHLLYQLPVRTVAEGEGVIATKPVQNDAASLYTTAFYGTNDPILADSIHFDSLPITVLPKTLQNPSEIQPPASPNVPALPRIDSNSAQPTISQPVITQPVSEQPSKTTAVITQVVTARPEARQPTPKISVDDRSVETNRETAPEVEQYLRSSINEAKPVLAPQTLLDAHTEELLQILAELVASRVSSLGERQYFGAVQTLSVISHIPLQKRQSGSVQLLRDSTQLGWSSVASRLTDVQHRHKTRRAEDVINTMLERLETNSSLQSQASSFQWEAVYSRVPMRRLPLRMLQQAYSEDGFADVDVAAIVEEIPKSPMALNLVGAIDGLLHSKQTGDLSFEFRRSAMKTLPLFEKTDALSTVELHSEIPSSATQTVESSEDEAGEPCGILDAARKTRPEWSSYLLAGLTSLYLVLRGRSRRYRISEAKLPRRFRRVNSRNADNF